MNRLKRLFSSPVNIAYWSGILIGQGVCFITSTSVKVVGVILAVLGMAGYFYAAHLEEKKDD